MACLPKKFIGGKHYMKENKAAYQVVDECKEEMIHLWEELVTMESGLFCKTETDAIGRRIASFIEKIGGRTRGISMDDAPDVLIGEFGDMTQPFVVLTGHMDTIFKKGTPEERPFRIEDGKAFGPGVLDMKGGIVILLYAVLALQKIGYKKYPIKVILVGDEEVGHQKSSAISAIQREAVGAKAAFNFETGFVDGGIVVKRKGLYQFMVEVFGKGAHVGNDPENGRSAIKEIAYKVLDIEALTDWQQGNTFNVGWIEGGTVPNATPAYAKIVCDLRCENPDTLPQIKQSIEEVVKKTYVEGTSTKLTPLIEAKAMKKLDASMELFAFVKKISEQEGFGTLYPKEVGGVSDSAYFTDLGIPTLCAMGVQGGRNHTIEEFAIVETLFSRTKLLCAVLLALA